MFNSFKKSEQLSGSKKESGFLTQLSRHSKKVAGILGFTMVVNIAGCNNNQEEIEDKNQLSKNDGEIVEIKKESNTGFKIHKVTKKGVGVLRFMLDNEMLKIDDIKNNKLNFDDLWKGVLINPKTGKILVKENGLILGESYLSTLFDGKTIEEARIDAKRLSTMIIARNETRSKTKIAEKKVEENETLKVVEKKEIVKNAEAEPKTVQIKKPDLTKKPNNTGKFNYKVFIESKIESSINPEMDRKIASTFKAGGEIGGSRELLKMVASVESSNGRFFDSYRKAVLEQDIDKKKFYIRQALSQIVANSNDTGIFQITPGWIETEIKHGFQLKGEYISDLSMLRNRIGKVLFEASIKGLSQTQVYDQLKNVDVRFDIEQMGEVIQRSYLRIYVNLGKYNLSYESRKNLALGAYNKGEGWAYKSAKSGKIGISEDLGKRLKHLQAFTNQNARILATNDDNYEQDISLSKVSYNEEVYGNLNSQIAQNISSLIDVRQEIKDRLIVVLENEAKFRQVIIATKKSFEETAKKGDFITKMTANRTIEKLDKINFAYLKMKKNQLGNQDLRKVA